MKEDFYTIIQEAAKIGATEVMKSLRPAEDLISQSAAYRRFGRRVIERYAREGRLTIIRHGGSANGKKLYSVAEIVSLNASRNIERSIINIESNARSC